MAQMLVKSGKLDEAKSLYQASIICCSRILGPNHLQTADIQMNYGKLQILRRNKVDAIAHFTEAYLIYARNLTNVALKTAEAAD
jgi:hypothetical protein